VPLLVAISVLSACVIGYEILLMRLFSIIQWHNFAYMIISLALLGYGAAGTFIALFRDRLLARFRAVFAAAAAAFGIAAPAAFALAQLLPFNPLELVWDIRQQLYLLGLYGLLAVPFFCAAICIGLAFARFGDRIEVIYRCDLLGAGAGALGIIVVLFALPPVDALRLIGAGGLVGGIIGSLVVATMSESLGNHIILVVTVFLVPIFFIIHRLKGIAGSQEADTRRETAVCGHEGKTPIAVMFEGGTTILASKYLICILAIVGVYEVISTWVDYLFFATLSDSIESRDAMSAYTGKVFTVAMFVALFVQVFVTTLVHRRWGVFYGLLFLPMTLLLGSAAFFFMPILMVIALTIAGEAAFGYSINQASKEILYVPLGTIAKYKSKAVIDMFVLRGGKAVGGIVLIAYTLWLSHHGFTSRFLMGLSVACVFLWLVAVRHIGRTFAEKERMEQARL